MPEVQVDKGAIRFVLGGANIMCPGLTSAGGKMEDELPEGTAVVRCIESKWEGGKESDDSRGRWLVILFLPPPLINEGYSRGRKGDGAGFGVDEDVNDWHVRIHLCPFYLY